MTTTITIPVDEVLEALGHGDNWTQGSYKAGDGKLCMHGGIRQCQVLPGDAYLIERVAAMQGWGIGWNDESGRVWSEVETTLQAHREVLPDELEATFGPQWEHIVSLVRRAAVLTADEAQSGALWDTASDAARGAASDAARGAASDAARGAAWDAARGAAWGAARDAAWGAAWAAAGAAAALSVRDLIGQHGFTQEHYGAMTLPWATVIGPAHPDDKPVSA